MKIYNYYGEAYTINQLSEISGILPNTLRKRLRSGYSVEEAVKPKPTHNSVIGFSEASYYMDWVGMSNIKLHEMYWNWCMNNGYNPITLQPFITQIIRLYPVLKVIPIRTNTGCSRIIRIRQSIN